MVPELPEVETVRRMLEPAMRGAKFRRVIVNRPNLRIPFPDRFIERLRGHTVEAVSRRGKYLIVTLSSGETLIMHLGMSGWFHVAPIGDQSREADPHDHVAFVMSSGQTRVFNDPRRFGFMDLAAAGQAGEYPSLQAMGPEPLSPEFDAAALARACRGKKISLKVALLDQTVVAGLGNIYASEALHHARISPLEEGFNDGAAIWCSRSATAVATRQVDQGSADERDPPEGIPVSIGTLSCLRACRAAVPAKGMRRHDRTPDAGRPIDVLLPGLPALSNQAEIDF